MLKKEFIAGAATRSGLTLEQMKRAVSAMVSVAAEALSTDDTVRVPGFVTLRAQHEAEHQARNPKTGVQVTVPARRRIYAKPTAALLASVDRAAPADDED